MVTTPEAVADPRCRSLPEVPANPLPYRRQVQALRQFHTGCETLRDAGGPVTRLTLGPRWLMPPVVIATSPQAGHDILGPSGRFVDRSRSHHEMACLLGPNLFTLEREEWLPRRRALQPVFTQKHVAAFGGHMAQAASDIAASWSDGEVVDLDVACRHLTLRALGRSVLGLDLDQQADSIGEPLRIVLNYVSDRSLRPVRAPRWLPTPARRRARAASRALHELAAEILRRCRADPDHEAPLVRALLEATDPDTGRGLSDDEICNDLVVFFSAGHDTTATMLTFALWALGRDPGIQHRVAREAAALGDRELTAADVPALPVTEAVLNESLRLCPPGALAARQAICDVGVDGYRVRAGTLVGFSIYAVQRDPALWEHALDFDPDRFLGPGRPDRWQYLPFGAGPRSCIGNHFAMLEATLALATIMRGVEIRSLGEDFPTELPFTLVAGAPIPAEVHARTES